MEDVLERLDMCRKLIVSQLNKSCGKQSIDILFNLRAVEIGIKPAFLFDYACIPCEKMATFLQSLYSQKVLKSPLAVLDVEGDLFIYKSDLLRSHLETVTRDIHGGRGPELVDTSASLSTPRALNMEDRTRILEKMLSVVNSALLAKEDEQNVSRDPSAVKKTISDSIPGFIKLNLDHSINRTTLFGLLLDYPVIYWYETQGESGDDGRSCLDMVPLQLTKISAEMSKHSREGQPLQKNTAVCLYSFSYPDCLHSHLKATVTGWIDKLKMSSSVPLKSRVETVVLPSVAM